MDAVLHRRVFSQEGDQGVSVGVAPQEAYLEKEQAGCPDCGTSSVPGENVAGYDRLNLKEQKSAQENGEGKDGHSGVG